MSDISANMAGNTYVSGPGSPPNIQAGATSGPPGSGGPGAGVSMTYAVVVPLAVAAGGLGALYYLFRREGASLPPLRVDAAQAMNVYLSWLLIQTPLKLLAYKYHGHRVAQAYLLVA